ncbi:MAG: serine hydrolase [bacterium]
MSKITKNKLLDWIVDFPIQSNLSLVLELPPGNKLISLHEDKIVHAASMMKLPVMATVFRLSREKKLNLFDHIQVKNSFPSLTSSDYFSLNQTLTRSHYQLIELVELMIANSDNQATNILINLVGFFEIEETLKIWCMHNTKIIRMIMDKHAFNQGLNNLTSAEDIACFFRKLWKGEEITGIEKNQMLDILKKQTIKDRIPSAVPEGIEIAHKTGSITGHCYDGGIIYTHPPFILVVLVYNRDDGVSVIQKITGNIFKFFDQLTTLH